MARASALRIDAGTAEVLSRFAAVGVDALLLKGPAIARWLYPEGQPRAYLDCDLLIAPADMSAAGTNPLWGSSTGNAVLRISLLTGSADCTSATIALDTDAPQRIQAIHVTG